MRYEFRTTDGRPCCTSDTLENLCARCRALVTPQHRAAADASSAVPPNPYAAVMVNIPQLTDDPAYDPKNPNCPPNSYTAALARQQRKERTR